MKTSIRQLTMGTAIAGLLAIGGVGLAHAQSDDATSDTTAAAVIVADPGTDVGADDSTTTDTDRPDRPDHAEELLTGDLADQVTEAALTAVPGGTIERVEADADGAVYEAHMTDADGNPVSVTFDADLAIVEIHEGGPGGPGGHGRHGGCDDDAAAATADSADATTDTTGS